SKCSKANRVPIAHGSMLVSVSSRTNGTARVQNAVMEPKCRRYRCANPWRSVATVSERDIGSKVQESHGGTNDWLVLADALPPNPKTKPPACTSPGGASTASSACER